MVDIVQVIQAAQHTTRVTVEIGLKAQIVKVSSFFFSLTDWGSIEAEFISFGKLQKNKETLEPIDPLKIN